MEEGALTISGGFLLYRIFQDIHKTYIIKYNIGILHVNNDDLQYRCTE
jgi:hypothetical protein